MYDAYFGFSDRPFAPVPRVDQYFPGTTIENARQTLSRCVERGEGVAMVVGPSGTGKTLLCQVLQRQFAGDFPVAVLSSGRLSTRRALLQSILYELGQPYRDMEEGELRLALIDHVTTSSCCPQGILLIVDEAHTLPTRLLDEIRMLTNIARDGQPRVRLVLVGSCLLEERFASHQLDSFNQRTVARCYLEAFSRTETQDYVRARVNAAAGLDSADDPGRQIFADDACESVHRVTDGVPRLINQVCDYALVLGYVGSTRQLQPAHVEEAWADLQQLPTPCCAEQGDAGGSVIEFGGLEDHATSPPAADCERQCVPSLKISPETDEPQEEASEPAEQLERIEEMLDNVEEGFQPAGSIGPEVELTFDDPFQEEFEHEEVVADPYVPTNAFGHEEVVADPYAPTVAAAGPADADAAQPEESVRDEPATVASANEIEHCAPDQGLESEPADDHRRVAAAVEVSGAPDVVEQPHEMVAGSRDTAPPTVPLRRPAALGVLELEDDRTVIIEDDSDEVVSARKCPIIAVKRHEFGQLFAKLRRG